MCLGDSRQLSPLGRSTSNRWILSYRALMVPSGGSRTSGSPPCRRRDLDGERPDVKMMPRARANCGRRARPGSPSSSATKTKARSRSFSTRLVISGVWTKSAPARLRLADELAWRPRYCVAASGRTASGRGRRRLEVMGSPALASHAASSAIELRPPPRARTGRRSRPRAVEPMKICGTVLRPRAPGRSSRRGARGLLATSISSKATSLRSQKILRRMAIEAAVRV